MDKTYLELIKEAKKDNLPAIVTFFNNGEITTEPYRFAKNIDKVSKNEGKAILDLMEDAAKYYSRHVDYDKINMAMMFGLIYDINDVDENNNIKEGAEPLKNITRYYNLEINSYLDGENNSPFNYFKLWPNRQGTIDYNDFVKFVKKQELSYDGPETFEELKEKILNKEIFDINVTAENLINKDEIKLSRKRRG